MISLIHLHIFTLIVLYINLVIFNKNTTNDLGSKYFFINYIYHNHKQTSGYLISYPFILIATYYIFEDVILVGSFFISLLYVYFLYEITSRENIKKKDEYLEWYKENVAHSFSMHAHDMIKKDFTYLSEKINRAFLFKFEIVLFICLVVESEVIYEALIVLNSMK